MSSIYIPTDDPFAILGILLLFTLIIVFLILLVFTARRSAQDVRKAVYDQSRYQRLMQLYWKQERRSLQDVEDGRGKGNSQSRVEGATRPSIIITAPAASSSLRSNAANDKAPSPRSTNSESGGTKSREGMLETHDDLATASTSLLGVARSPRQRPRRADGLPRTLRIGRQTPLSRPPRRSGYQRLGGEDPADGGREDAV